MTETATSTTTLLSRQEPPQPTLKELKACQFSSYYPTFRKLPQTSKPYPHRNVTIKSVILPSLPPAFLEYLQRDGVILPKGAEKVSSFLPTDTLDDWSSDEDQAKEGGGDSVGDEEQTQEPLYHFPELNESIQAVLDELGPVLPKLNWSAPRDVTWINDSSLKCETIGDVYLLLKSSDFCTHDLNHALEGIQLDEDRDELKRDQTIESIFGYELVLRKWSHLHKSMEFRCFVSHHQLLAVSQRNHSLHFPHLKKEQLTIREQILDFYEACIRDNYAEGAIPDYVFDVYVDKNGRVWLIDFNLWATRTDSLMFDWDELMQLSHQYVESVSKKHISVEQDLSDTTNVVEVNARNQEFQNENPEIRVVETENEIHYDPLASYRAPIDTVDLGASNSFKAFMAMCEKPS